MGTSEGSEVVGFIVGATVGIWVVGVAVGELVLGAAVGAVGVSVIGLLVGLGDGLGVGHVGWHPPQHWGQ